MRDPAGYVSYGNLEACELARQGLQDQPGRGINLARWAFFTVKSESFRSDNGRKSTTLAYTLIEFIHGDGYMANGNEAMSE